MRWVDGLDVYFNDNSEMQKNNFDARNFRINDLRVGFLLNI